MDLDQAIKDKSARIAVIGMGYVGLPTAVNFAENGFNVIGVSRTREKVSAINQGFCYLKDLNIDERVARVVRRKKLTATTDTAETTTKSDVIVIMVPTPITPRFVIHHSCGPGHFTRLGSGQARHCQSKGHEKTRHRDIT